MLQLTKRAEYGLIALVHLSDAPARGAFGGGLGLDGDAAGLGVGASRSGVGRGTVVTSAREISERCNIPRRLLAEVMKDLCRAGIVESTRGAQGGYALARDPRNISLGEIIGTLDGSAEISPCTDLAGWLRGFTGQSAPVGQVPSELTATGPTATGPTGNEHEGADDASAARLTSGLSDSGRSESGRLDAEAADAGPPSSAPVRSAPTTGTRALGTSPAERVRAGIWGLLQRTSLRDLARGAVQAGTITHPPGTSPVDHQLEGATTPDSSAR